MTMYNYMNKTSRWKTLWAVKALLVLLVSCFSLLPSSAADKDKFVLVIDAGHGGKDAGACANRAKEKNINLSVALAFGKLVEQNCSDVKVIYTRKTDVFIPLHERADIANRNKADVFISIHTNSVESRRAVSGMETYTMGMRRSDEKRSAAMRENEVITMELSAYQMPRPQWDVQLLVEAGFERISVDMGVYRRIYQEIDEFYNPASIFTIAAWK